MSFIWRRGLQHYRSCGARWGNCLNSRHPPSPCSQPMLTPLNYPSQPIHSQIGGNTHLGQAVVVYPKAIPSCLTSGGITPRSTTAHHEGEEKIDDGPTIEGVLEEIDKVKDILFSLYVDDTEVIHDRLISMEVSGSKDAFTCASWNLCYEITDYLDELESRGVDKGTMSKDFRISEVLQFCPLMTDILKMMVRQSATRLKENVALTRGAYREHTEVAAKRQLQEFLDYVLSESDCDILETYGVSTEAACGSYSPLLTSVVYYRAFLALLELIIKHIVSCDSPEDMKKRVKEDVANGNLSFVLDEESKVLAEGKVDLPVIPDDDVELDEETRNFLIKFYFEGGHANYVP